jgi:SDR family mycofactocin-dependent oxidoreductase
MAGRVQGKVAFITGAARGQGRAHAVKLAREGADIIATDLCADEVASVAGMLPLGSEADLAETGRLVKEAGGRVVTRKADVRDLAELQRAVEEGAAELGRLDVVVANAGIVTFAPTWELTEQQWRDMIDINLTGVFHTAKATVPHLLDADEGGSIVFTSSVAGLKGMPNIGHYVAAKHGVVGLMRALANELGPHHIRVNTVNPTSVDTPLVHVDAAYQVFAPHLENPSREEVIPAFSSINGIPVPWVDTEDVANAVLFLASEESRFVTGTTLTVDAGAAVK